MATTINTLKLDADAQRMARVGIALRDGVEPSAADVGALNGWRGMYDDLLNGAQHGRFNGALHAYRAEAPALVDAIEHAPAPPPSVTLADLAALLPSITWLWPGYLVRGFVNLLVAEPGSGKTALALWLARGVLYGLDAPDGQPIPVSCAPIVWLDTEASQAILLERATNYGIDASRIIIPHVDANDVLSDVLLDTPQGRDALEREVIRHKPPLIVVDSLSGSNRQSEKDSQQELMSYLAALARNHDAAVLVVHHLRKRSAFEDTNTVDLDRVRGHGSIVAMSRVVLAVDRPDPHDKERQRLAVIKTNLGKKAPELGFTIADNGLEFCAPPQPPREETTVDKAAEFIRARLSRAPMDAAAILAEGQEAGFTAATMQRAREALAVKPVKVGKSWRWSLPASEKQ